MRYLYVARRCHHLWRYTMLSYGQWRREPGRTPGQHNSWPPYRPTPPPAHEKYQLFCVCVCVCVSIVESQSNHAECSEAKIFFRWAPLIKILDPPLTSYQKTPQKPSLARAPTTGLGPGALAPPCPPPSPRHCLWQRELK